MTFLNPLILWALPLILLPVLIHLFNRLRHRKLPWAAMMFLRMANRKSTRYAKLRQWLVLLFRVLAVLALLFALSRPLAGGRLGGFLSSKPDVVVIIFDRSPSMDGRVADESRLDKVRRDVLKDAEAFGDGCRLVLFDHAATNLQEVADLSALKNLMSGGTYDSAANIPAQLEMALEWFESETPGRGEIWIASDFQASNWDPASGERWQRLSAGFEGLPQKVRVRMVSMDSELGSNASVRVNEVQLLGEGTQAEVQLEVEVLLDKPVLEGYTVPVTVHLGTEQRTVDVDFKLEGSSHTQFIRLPIDNPAEGGWGWVAVPDDDNPSDNRGYFVYGSHRQLSTAVVAEDAYVGRFLQLAAAPNTANTNQVAVAVDPNTAGDQRWADHAMVLWQGALPEGDDAKGLLEYVNTGGMLVCFPGPADSDTEFAGLKWGALQPTQNKQGRAYPSWREMVAAQGEGAHLGPVVVSWEESEGPLARTEEGFSLPMDRLHVAQRRAIEGEGILLASIARDSEPGRRAEPLVIRKVQGKGQLVLIGTAPTDTWSSLNNTIVLPIMLQRLLADGAASGSGRFSADRMLAAGDNRARAGERWVSVGVEEGESRDFNTQAGVYRLGKQMVAVNRPVREDLVPGLEAEEAEKLFGDMSVTVFSESREGLTEDPKEIWKWFLALMALALLVEGFLILPKSTDERVVISRSDTGKVAPETT